MKNACKLKHDNEQVQEKCDVVLPLLWVWRPGFDCNRFLDVLAIYWNAFGALNCALGMKTVSNFL